MPNFPAIAALPLVTVDAETHLLRPGMKAPRSVCWAVCSGPSTERLMLREEGLDQFFALLSSRQWLIGGTNIFFDCLVACADRPEFIPEVFAALREGRLVDSVILETLHRNAIGMLREFNEFSQGDLEKLYLGIDRSDEKEAADAWRLRYGELDGVPLSEWEDAAIQYPRKDAGYSWQILTRQLYGEGRENLQCVTQEMMAGWTLELACSRGLPADRSWTEVIAERVQEKHEISRRRFFEEGFTRVRLCNKKDSVYEAGSLDATVLYELQQLITKYPASRAAQGKEQLSEIEACLKKLPSGRPWRWAEHRKNLRLAVHKAYGGSPPYTKGGEKHPPEISIARDTLEESDDELLEEYAEAGPNEKLFSQFIPMLRAASEGVRITPSFTTSLATQRCSLWGPNLQQLPREGHIREALCAPEGSLFVSMDYSSWELVTFAQILYTMFGNSPMRDAINAGIDLHLKLGGGFLGLPYAQAQELYKAGDKKVANQRQAAKAFNFGVPGLMGPPKIIKTARAAGTRFCELAGEPTDCRKNPKVHFYAGRSIPPTCSVCLELAIYYRKVYFQENPDVAEYHKFTVARAEDCASGTPITSFGTGLRRLETSANAVSNHFFQNLAAQGAKWANWKLTEEAFTDPSSILYGNLALNLPIHDEAFCEVREEVAHECALRATEILRAGAQEFTPDVTVSIEPALMRRWFKGAKTVYGHDGRLKPWWPKNWDFEPDRPIKQADMAQYA